MRWSHTQDGRQCGEQNQRLKSRDHARLIHSICRTEDNGMNVSGHWHWPMIKHIMFRKYCFVSLPGGRILNINRSIIGQCQCLKTSLLYTSLLHVLQVMHTKHMVSMGCACWCTWAPCTWKAVAVHQALREVISEVGCSWHTYISSQLVLPMYRGVANHNNWFKAHSSRHMIKGVIASQYKKKFN